MALYKADGNSAGANSTTIYNTDTTKNFSGVDNNTPIYASLTLSTADAGDIQEYSQFFMIRSIPTTITDVTLTAGDETISVAIGNHTDDSNLIFKRAEYRFKKYGDTDYGSVVSEVSGATNNITFASPISATGYNGYRYDVQVRLVAKQRTLNAVSGVATDSETLEVTGDWSSVKSVYPKANAPIIRKIERTNDSVKVFIESEGTNVSQVHFIPGGSATVTNTTVTIAGDELDGDDTETAGTHNREAFEVVFTLSAGPSANNALDNYVAIVDAPDAHGQVVHTYNQDSYTLGLNDTHNWNMDPNPAAPNQNKTVQGSPP